MTTPGAGVARVVCEQLAPRIADVPYNTALVLETVRRDLADGADVVVLPELVTSGYVLDSPQEAHACALAPDDPFFTELAALLAGTATVVVLGFCEAGDPLPHNSAAVVDATGIRAVYRKTHLWDRETLLFTPGTAPAPVVTTAHGRIGVLVCYDLEFPEMTRALALAGADLVAVPTNWPRCERPAGERPAEIVHAQSAARANGVFIACADRHGTERGQEWTEGSAVIDQFGWPRATAGAPGHRIAVDLFPHLARDKSTSPHNDLLGDRRPDVYVQETPLA